MLKFSIGSELIITGIYGCATQTENFVVLSQLNKIGLWIKNVE